MTTWTDMIQKMDNYRYVGKVNKPVKRVNKVYVLIVGECKQTIHTEYHTVDRIAMERIMERYNRYVEKMHRYELDAEDEQLYLANPHVQITDRDGKISFVEI